MTNLSVALSEIWNFIKDPKFIIMYMAVMVALMGLIVVTAMISEHRFGNVTADLKKSAEKASKHAEKLAGSSRFEMLKAIDARPRPVNEFVTDFTLADMCREFRNFSAGELGLYYDESTIRAFVSGLAVSRLLILQGISGSGKTSLAFAFGEFVRNSATVIPVQSMWKERADLLGYYNEFTKRFNETPLLCKMYEANKHKDMYVAILDELNIARVEYYFAEFLSLMELPDPDMRNLEVVSDSWDSDPRGIINGCIRLPENMWFVGTVNDDDSAYAISDKVFDRAMAVDLDDSADRVDCEDEAPSPVSYDMLCALMKQANGVLSQEGAKAILALDEYLTDVFGITFGNRIRRQISAYVSFYVACGGSETEALDDILAKKVLRKLEYRDVSRLHAELSALKQLVRDLFGTASRCEKYIDAISGK